jgi:choline dehydrogenase-like flavoprotein
MSWSDNEQRMIQHMQTQIQEMVELMGGQCIRLTELVRSPFYPERIRQLESQVMDAAPPGYYIHEVGGAPMGTSPRNSVVNPFNQLWESPNILVVDGACWTTAGWQNPTLTEMAITARACDYLVSPWKKTS